MILTIFKIFKTWKKRPDLPDQSILTISPDSSKHYYEVCQTFVKQGFPEGRLGEMLRAVYEIKVNGLEYLFKPLRDID